MYEELGRAELTVKLRAKVGLSVSFRGRQIPFKNDRRLQMLVVDMRFTALFTEDNSQEDVLSYRIEDDEAVSHILGLNFCKREKGPAREQQTLLAYTKPKANFDGAVIMAGENAPFGLEILVDNNPVAPSDEDGIPVVSLRRDQNYAIRVINRSPIEMAVRLSVDGFNVFNFSELRQKDGPYKGAPQYELLLVAPKDNLIVPGWHRDNNTSVKFKITDYAETAAAKMNKTTDLGTITATFSAVWGKERHPMTSRKARERQAKTVLASVSLSANRARR